MNKDWNKSKLALLSLRKKIDKAEFSAFLNSCLTFGSIEQSASVWKGRDYWFILKLGPSYWCLMITFASKVGVMVTPLPPSHLARNTLLPSHLWTMHMPSSHLLSQINVGWSAQIHSINHPQPFFRFISRWNISFLTFTIIY